MKLIELTYIQDPPLVEMANLFKKDTGLDYPIWIGTVGGQHRPRVKVSNIKGKWSENSNFVISVSRTPEILTPESCKIDNKEVNKVLIWIITNFDDLMTLWWMFEHGAATVKDEDTGKVIDYDNLVYGLKKV